MVQWIESVLDFIKSDDVMFCTLNISEHSEIGSFARKRFIFPNRKQL